MSDMRLVDERDQLFPPLDRWVEVVKPCHSENDIIPREWERNEIDGVSVGADAEWCARQQGRRRLTATIGEGDDTLRLHRGAQLMASDEVRRDEVTGGATVEEDDSWMPADDAGDLQQLPRD